MNKQFTKIQVLEAVAKAYTFNTRSLLPGTTTCLYSGPDGKACAFAMFIKVGSRWKLQEHTSAGDQEVLTEDFIKGVQHLSSEWSFWIKVQLFHDTPANWNHAGLSEEGERELSRLKKLFE